MPILELDRKTNVLALTSFLLSLIAIGNQFYGYLLGARVELFAPAVIVLSEYDHGTKAAPARFLAIEAVMTYANKGQIGYNDVVKRETVSFMGPAGQPVLLTWNDFLEGSTADPQNPDRKIYASIKPASPRVIAARDAISHETRFVAFNEECPDSQAQDCSGKNFVPVDEALFRYLAGQPDAIEFKFTADLYGDEQPRHAACRILTRQIDMEAYRRRGWISLNCYPVKT